MTDAEYEYDNPRDRPTDYKHEFEVAYQELEAAEFRPAMFDDQAVAAVLRRMRKVIEDAE